MPDKISLPNKVSLSNYFPVGTHYFYGYPAGDNADFLNKVPPITEELVAARPIGCAGPGVSAVCFSATSPPSIDSELLTALAIPQVSSEHVTILPSTIDEHLVGKERNEAIMTALSKTIAPGHLVMAQPFTDDIMASLYQIPAQTTIWLNDKSNMPQYIEPGLMPKRFGSYRSGTDFVLHGADVTLPCVVKVSSSSSGDGVYICIDKQAFLNACQRLEDFKGTIVVESYIETKKNYALHFGIPYDQTKPIDIIGFNEQLTTPDGEFLGGFIDANQEEPTLAVAKQYLLTKILPKARSMGWYGVGGFDVIIDKNNKPYFIDCNFRMTGMSAYHFMVSQKKITTPLVSFAGHYNGSQAAFEHAILPHAGIDSQTRMVQLIALSKHGQQWSFNGALMYHDKVELKQRLSLLKASGIISPTLASLARDN